MSSRSVKKTPRGRKFFYQHAVKFLASFDGNCARFLKSRKQSMTKNSPSGDKITIRQVNHVKSTFNGKTIKEKAAKAHPQCIIIKLLASLSMKRKSSAVGGLWKLLSLNSLLIYEVNWFYREIITFSARCYPHSIHYSVHDFLPLKANKRAYTSFVLSCQQQKALV